MLSDDSREFSCVDFTFGVFIDVSTLRSWRKIEIYHSASEFPLATQSEQLFINDLLRTSKMLGLLMPKKVKSIFFPLHKTKFLPHSSML